MEENFAFAFVTPKWKEEEEETVKAHQT